MIDSQLGGRRRFLRIALAGPLALAGCGGSADTGHIQVGEATQAEVKSRAEAYRQRVQQKKQNKSAPRR